MGSAWIGGHIEREVINDLARAECHLLGLSRLTSKYISTLSVNLYRNVIGKRINATPKHNEGEVGWLYTPLNIPFYYAASSRRHNHEDTRG